MRDYIDDESYGEDVGSEEESNEEEVELENDESLPIKKRAKYGKKNGEKGDFDEDEFDRKVAVSVVKIHQKVKGDDKFSLWVEKNLTHLQNLYSLSNLECSPVDFFTYVYNNSSGSRNFKMI